MTASEVYGARKVRALLKRSRTDLQQRLARYAKDDRRFTPERMRATMEQVELAEQVANLRMRGLLETQTKAAVETAMDQSTSYLRASERAYAGVTVPLSLERAMLFDAEVEGVQASLLRQHETSVARYGLRSISKFEEVMQEGIVQQLGTDEVVSRMVDADAYFEAREYWAERIVRTELLSSYGRSSLRAIQVTRDRDWPDLRKVLVGTFDNRTGRDTYAVDGQVRRPEEPFVWRAGPGFVPRNQPPFMNTPKRPMCRCLTVAWRSKWPPPQTRNELWGDVPPLRFRAA